MANEQKEYLDKDGLTLYNTLIRGDTTPVMDGTASTGSSKKFARADHIHPSDTSKVDKETGKGLSTNDFTTSEKTKLDELPTGPEIVLKTTVGQSNGVASLDANGKVPTTQLPSFVDDVIESYPVSGATELSAGWLSATSGGAPFTPESGKIYILMEDSASYATNTQFRWGGTAYVKMLDGGIRSITSAEIQAIVNS